MGNPNDNPRLKQSGKKEVLERSGRKTGRMGSTTTQDTTDTQRGWREPSQMGEEGQEALQPTGGVSCRAEITEGK